MRLLVTGCAGFIGSNFVRCYLQQHPQDSIIGLDKLTYAGNRANLAHADNDPRFRFVQADIADSEAVGALTKEVDAVVNFAAESHVDRSLLDPDAFIRTNVVGLHVLLEASRQAGVQRFLQVSTDEVYGHVPAGLADESAPLAPRNPYSASKAGGDLLVQSYWHSHGLPVVLTRGANTIGPYQYPEKVTPLFVTNALDDQPLPIYGQGTAVRDYLYVDDHCAAIALVLHDGAAGQVYNVGANEEVNTVELASPHPRPARQAADADAARGRPPRPRLPLQHGQRSAARPGLAAALRPRRDRRGDRPLVRGPRELVATDQVRRLPRILPPQLRPKDGRHRVVGAPFPAFGPQSTQSRRLQHAAPVPLWQCLVSPSGRVELLEPRVSLAGPAHDQSPDPWLRPRGYAPRQ